MLKRQGFTLIEVLISLALLGLIVPALYSSVDMLHSSNQNLFKYLEKSKKITKITDIFYLDILRSDGNITIKKNEFARLCIEKTQNSLYALPVSKVCWIILKEGNILARVEGNAYTLPLNPEQRVEINPIMKDIELFDVYHQKDKVLVLLQQKDKEPISFMVQGIFKPKTKEEKQDRKGQKSDKSAFENTHKTNTDNHFLPIKSKPSAL